MNSSRTAPVALVRFMVQISGSQPPLEEQNAATEASRADQWLLGIGVDGAGRAEAHGDHARLDIAGADGAHHVVAAAAGHYRLDIDTQLPGDLGAYPADWLVGL